MSHDIDFCNECGLRNNSMTIILLLRFFCIRTIVFIPNQSLDRTWFYLSCTFMLSVAFFILICLWQANKCPSMNVTNRNYVQFRHQKNAKPG